MLYNMNSFEIDISLKQLLSSNEAFHYRIVPIKEEDGIIVLKTDVENLEALTSELNLFLSFGFKLEKDSTDNVTSYLSYNFRKETSVSDEISKTNFLNQLLQTAKDFNSSDIHIEPYESSARVRFRTVSYTHLRAHETSLHLVCRLLLEKKK